MNNAIHLPNTAILPRLLIFLIKTLQIPMTVLTKVTQHKRYGTNSGRFSSFIMLEELYRKEKLTQIL